MIYTANQFKVSLSISGVRIDNKSWDKFQGAGHTMETQNYAAGGMVPSVATGGVSKRNQATIERAEDTTLEGAYAAIDGSVGNAVSVSVTPLKTPTTRAGRARTFTGVVREFHPPDEDSTSSSIRMYQIVIELNEPMTT